MTGIEVALLGSAATAATATTAATAATAGLFGVGGSFALGTTLGTLGTIASVGSTLFGGMAQQQQAAGEISSTRYNSALERVSAAEDERKLRREQYLRGGAQMASAGAQGRGMGGNVLDIMADTAYQSEMDILGLRTATQMSQDLARSKISNIKKTSKISTASNILTGAAKLVG